MVKETEGIIIAIKKQWWLKINTKALRTNTLDGAKFPHVVKAKYVVDGTEYVGKKWVSIYDELPKMNQIIRVYYEEDNPKKAKIKL